MSKKIQSKRETPYVSRLSEVLGEIKGAIHDKKHFNKFFKSYVIGNESNLKGLKQLYPKVNNGHAPEVYYGLELARMVITSSGHDYKAQRIALNELLRKFNKGLSPTSMYEAAHASAHAGPADEEEDDEQQVPLTRSAANLNGLEARIVFEHVVERKKLSRNSPEMYELLAEDSLESQQKKAERRYTRSK